MTHKVYAFVGQQPHGLVDEFKTRLLAKECASRVERDGIKVLGNMHPVAVRIVAKTA